MEDTITISKSGTLGNRQIKINSNWCKGSEYFSLKQEESCLTITKHYMEIPDTARKNTKSYFHLPCTYPLGKHDIDLEESSEDELVIYFDWMEISC